MSKGVESIRIKGRAIEDLPLGQGNEAKAQLPYVIEQERLNNIEGVIAKYPTHRIDYLLGVIKECEENKTRMRKTITELNTMTSNYKGQIKMCEHRDKQLAKLDEDADDFKAKKKALFKEFPPYSVPAMEQQIVQNGEGIERCDKVIIAEDASITQFTEALTLCRQRDKELKLLGAQAAGS